MTLPNLIVANDAEDDFCEQQRCEPRNNIFVAAVLYHRDGSTPVRIRNMSRSGALIECAELSSEDSEIRLCRGSRVAHGRIAWRSGDRAGIRFDGVVDVAGWLPNGDRDKGQQRVDAIIDECRSAAPTGLEQLAPATAISNLEIIRQLLGLRESLNQAAEDLASNATIAIGHAQALQTLDLAAYKLDKLAGRFADIGQIPPSTGS